MYKLFKGRSGWYYVFIISFGVINSIWNLSLLALINATISRTSINWLNGYEAYVFLIILILSLLSSRHFQGFMIKLTNDLSYEATMSVIRKLRCASFQHFEVLGKENVYTAIEDAQTVSSTPRMLISAFNSLIVVVCCVGYIFFISVLGGSVIVLIMALLIVFFAIRNNKLERGYNVVRNLQSDYYVYLNDLLHGFKEIKMSINRNDNLYHEFLDKNRVKSKQLFSKVQLQYVNNNLAENYIFYILVGVVLFSPEIFFNNNFGNKALYIIAILYLIAPLGILVDMIPQITKVKVSAERLNAFENQLEQLVKNEPGSEEDARRRASFRSLSFVDVEYCYYDYKKHEAFALGPLNVEIEKGEIIFLTGGNGSGKSTFVNIIAGLYKPSCGQVYLNGKRIEEPEYAFFGNQISAIFSNNYLFNENYDRFDLGSDNGILNKYIKMVQLENILQFEGDKNKISNKLSKGQQKRLAMIYALMEERELLVLDEWAAEQEPQFRAYFYKKLLPELKRLGKTIVAVTHDDEYFSVADRVLHFKYGKISNDEKFSEKEASTKSTAMHGS